MARGGMYDQLAGGFARYSVDAQWVVPHFEKMLYDNALLLRVYLHWWRRTGRPLAERVARETADFLCATWAQPRAASPPRWTPTPTASRAHLRLDAGSAGDVLGADDGAAAAELFAVTAAGTFEHGASTLQLPRRRRADPVRHDGCGERLLAARAARPQPGRDDKVVTAWNGLAVAALAEAGVLLDAPDYLAAACGAPSCCWTALGRRPAAPGLARRASAGTPLGVLEDYADLAEGLLVLHQVTADAAGWPGRRAARPGAGAVLRRRRGLLRHRRRRRAAGAPAAGPHRQRDAGRRSALAGALLTYAALTGSERHRRRPSGC